MTLKEAAHLIKESIREIHEPREINAITDWILEDLTGLKRVDRLLFEGQLDTQQKNKLHEYLGKLSKATPVQYVTGYAWFMGKKVTVNEHVLIPRPETEELVEWTLANTHPGMKVIDIGTGSGCIPVSIKYEKPEVDVYAVDFSKEALNIAKENADAFGLDIHFSELDILQEENWEKLPALDIIISNPPYIPYLDKDTMDKHVVEHEPHLALFVPENDPLVFYNAIIKLAEIKLNAGGKLFFETHYALASEVAALTTWTTAIRKDAFGKERMVCITKP